MRSLDPKKLDPGIRDVVVALRAAGWDTCDSGDGSKRGEGTLSIPHVAIVVAAEAWNHVPERSRLILRTIAAVDKREGWIVEAGYSTVDGVLTFVASLPQTITGFAVDHSEVRLIGRDDRAVVAPTPNEDRIVVTDAGVVKRFSRIEEGERVCIVSDANSPGWWIAIAKVDNGFGFEAVFSDGGIPDHVQDVVDVLIETFT